MQTSELSSLFEELIDKKLAKILILLAKNKDELYHLKKISGQANVPLSTVFRIMPLLVRLDIALQVNVGKLKLYRLADNNKARQLKEVFGK